MMKEKLKNTIRGLHQDHNIFHDLSEEELEKIAPFLERNHYSSGATLFKEGDPGDYLGIVASGKLQAKKKTELQGRQVVLAVLGKGSFAGELSLLDERPRSATVEALEDSELIILKKEALDSIIRKYPEIGVKIIRRISRVVSIRARNSGDRLTKIF